MKWLLALIRIFILLPIRNATATWNQFWFSPVDPLPLCVLRLLSGGMLVYTHYVWGINLEAFFGQDGWHSVEAMQQFQQFENAPSLWWFISPEMMRTAHTAMLVILILFFLGVATPVTSVLALIITISNSNRAPIANYGLDQILSFLTLYLAIGPSGARLSVDSLWRKFRNKPSVQPSWRANLSLRLSQYHYCIIYFFAGIGKLQGEAWWTGKATWMSFAIEEYQSLDMTWLAHYPLFTQFMTHVTIVWEISFAFVIWNKAIRPWMLLVGTMMHLGIVFFLGMPTFGLIMIFGYIAFFSANQLRSVLPTKNAPSKTEQPKTEQEKQEDKT